MTKPKPHQGEKPAGAVPEAPAAPEAAAAPTPPADMAQLQQQLEEKTKEAQENYARALRLAADMENLKKRLEREKADLLQFANENLIKELLARGGQPGVGPGTRPADGNPGPLSGRH